LTVQVSDPATGRVDLLVTGISMDRLASSRDISRLVEELREDLEGNRQTFLHVKAG
jgi:hypothetical protein